MSFTFS